jgi:acyl CoA:acetate/3-ketoacid CoA transferase beta subunit
MTAAKIKARISYDEIMCSVASREIKDGESVFVGQGNPILAALLALKAGKRLTLVMEGASSGFHHTARRFTLLI